MRLSVDHGGENMNEYLDAYLFWRGVTNDDKESKRLAKKELEDRKNIR
jgi:hypothetical protein